jgi:hypothetical protein
MFNAPNSREWKGGKLGDEDSSTGKCNFDFPENEDVFKCIREAIEKRISDTPSTS